MIDFDLVNEASKQISELLNVQKLKSVSSYDDLFNFYNIKYITPCKTQNLIEEKYSDKIITELQSVIQYQVQKHLNSSKQDFLVANDGISTSSYKQKIPNFCTNSIESLITIFCQYYISELVSILLFLKKTEFLIDLRVKLDLLFFLHPLILQDSILLKDLILYFF